MALDGAVGSAGQARALTGASARTVAQDRRRDPPDLRDLEARLGHVFADKALLTHALTHIGAAGGVRRGSYQRLEFLGDRVLGLAVAALLYRTFPDAVEGELSRRLADLVRRESCAAVAADWLVEPHIRLGPGERAALRRAILGDVCEAIIGAVFLDGGMTAAGALVERAFAALMHAPARPLRDAKTALQEWAQARGLAAPVYRERNRSGPDHAPAFTVAVVVEAHPDAEATGASKRVAEQAAATAFMEREGLVREEQHSEASHG